MDFQTLLNLNSWTLQHSLPIRVTDIKVEHHPNSGIKMKVHPFDSFHRRPAASSVHTPPDNQPWCPFQSQLEFNIAELALEARLNNEQTDRLIRICLHSSVGKDKFTFRNHKDIHSKWEAASHWITKVVSFTTVKSEYDLVQSAVHERSDLSAS
ncbi:uncharacterized protein EDB93DRAFT_1096942 [Suillus bovinus]|uniref:uncharacterized protein n=1 Tax=Suillus bovinus TaxID=48563 RepID=UPI001B86ABFB|nr:uncharacterized protein EDB93DRAFT_1096942 [Suillus bovinus]KAG2126861.1 hypothetical protein EDB93DRAFT_1096942 [Suillus bovinus]